MADLDRLTDFLLASQPEHAQATAGLVLEALDLLTRHPLTGRPVDGGQREFVISRGRSGYLALYDFDPGVDAVVIMRIRHQREAGYPG